jgi:hypothetical protein
MTNELPYRKNQISKLAGLEYRNSHHTLKIKSSEIKIKSYSMNYFLPESSDAELEKETVDDPDTVTQCKAVVCHHSLYLKQKAIDDSNSVDFDQGHLLLLLKHPRQTCISRESNPGRLRRRRAL